MSTLSEPITSNAPNETETLLARQGSQKLAALLQNQDTETLRLRVQNGNGDSQETAEEIVVSGAALRLFVQVLETLGKGHAVSVLSETQELTPQQAAAFLGMSRTLLTRLLDRQEIPFRYVGSHKRIACADLLAFCTEQKRRNSILDELTAQAQELGLYP